MMLLFATNAQVRKSMSQQFKNFDFKSLLHEFASAKDLTTDEMILGAESYYRLGDFDKAEIIMDSVANITSLTSKLICFQNDIKENRTREIIGAPKFEAALIFNNSDGSCIASLIESGRVLISKSGPPNGMFESRDIQTEQSFLKLFEASLTNDKLVGFELITEKKASNIGPVTSYLGGYILTENYIEKKAQRNLKLTFLDSAFNTTGSFPFNDPSYSIGHACYDETRERLIFVSDMPEGNGSTDLWYSEMRGGAWQKPVLMESLNTPGNEMFPTIFNDILYFSTNGRVGYGGLDVYYVDLKDNSEFTISHLPSPINSRYDDFELLWIEENREAILNSNRLKGKNDLVYRITIENGTFDCSTECANEGCRQFSINGFEEIDPHRYEFLWDFGNGETANGPFASQCYTSKGNYIVRLSVKDLETGLTEKDVMVEEIEIVDIISNFPMFEITGRPEVNKPITIKENSLIATGEPQRVLWETDDLQSSIEEVPSFTFSSTGFHWIKRSIKVLGESACCHSNFKSYFYVSKTPESKEVFNPISAKIDSSCGFETYRAIITFDREYPNEQISATLIDLETGEKFPFVSSTDSFPLVLRHDREYEIHAQNSQNAQTKETVVSSNKTELEYSRYHLAFGQNRKLVQIVDKMGHPIPRATVALNDSRYLTNSSGITWLQITENVMVKASMNGYWGSKKEINATDLLNDTIRITLQKMELNTVHRLENIHFDLNKSDIREDAALILDELVITLQNYPEMHIQLNAHTDSRGRDQYNLSLSDQRAQSTVNYLSSKGIDKTRLRSKGFGETLLLNNCVNNIRCSYEEHQLNRRVEVIITKM